MSSFYYIVASFVLLAVRALAQDSFGGQVVLTNDETTAQEYKLHKVQEE